jgi:hypothetical protein
MSDNGMAAEPCSIVDLLMSFGIGSSRAFHITEELLAWMKARPDLLAAFFPDSCAVSSE